MEPVQLYVNNDDGLVSRVLLSADREKLIQIGRKNSAAVPEHYARVISMSSIKRNNTVVNVPCACPDSIVLEDSGIIVPRRQHAVAGYPGYFIETHCNDKELFTLVVWLTRNRYQRFYNRIENGSLVRYLAPNKVFRKLDHETCAECERHVLSGDPVLCLKHIVLSQYNKGPTVESVTLYNT